MRMVNLSLIKFRLGAGSHPKVFDVALERLVPDRVYAFGRGPFPKREGLLTEARIDPTPRTLWDRNI
jgi:hypothetical protein